MRIRSVFGTLGACFLLASCGAPSPEGSVDSGSPSLPAEVTLTAPGETAAPGELEQITPQLTLIQTITLPGQADSGALSPDGSQLFVLDTTAPQIFFIDLLTSELTSAVSIGRDSPYGRDGDLEVQPSGNTLFAVIGGTPELISFDLESGERNPNRPLPSVYSPGSISMSPDGNQLAVGGAGMPTLDLVSTRSGKQDSNLSAYSYVSAYSPDGRLIYTVDGSGVALIAVYDVKSKRKMQEYRVGEWPVPLRISPDGKTGYANSRDSGIIAFDTASGDEINRFMPEYGGNVADIALSPDGNFLYVSQLSGDLLYALNTADMTVVPDTTVSMDAFAGSIEVSSDGSRLYVMSPYDGKVLVYQTGL